MVAFSFQEIKLPATQLKAVERKAKLAGRTAPEYVRLLIEQDLLADKSFDEILRPIRQDVRKSGVTESQLDAMVRRARGGPRRQKRTSSHSAASPKNRTTRR